MDGILSNIINKFETRIQEMNSVRHAGVFRQMQVTVLGQQGLLIRQASLKELSIINTTDFDGLLNGEPPLEDIFKNIIREEGLSYDEQSKYIWLPEETTYELIYKSEFIEVLSPLPIYLIVSKAVKAPEKNRQLVLQAIEYYQDSLIELLEKYGADLNYFING